MMLGVREVLLMVCFVVPFSIGATEEELDNHACTHFSRTDANHDLKLDQDDYTLLYLRLQTSDCVSSRLEVAKNSLIRLLKLFKPPVTDFLSDRPVYFKSYLEGMRNRRKQPTLSGEIADQGLYLRSIFNCDGDEYTLTKREFRAAYKVFDITDEVEVQASFAGFDKNGDGNISFYEGYRTAYVYFYGYDGTCNDNSSDLYAGYVKTCLEVANNNPDLLP